MARMQGGGARFVAGATDAKRFPPPHGPEIAFAGRSNVGKSSLLNRLVGSHKLARVSKTPGRTQQINFFSVAEGITFVDLPGYGFARVPLAIKDAWKQLVESYLTRRRNLCGVIVLVDLRRDLEADDAALLDFLRAHALPALIIATKADKLARGARLQRTRQLASTLAARGVPLLVCSAVSGEGMAEVWQAIEALAGNRE